METQRNRHIDFDKYRKIDINGYLKSIGYTPVRETPRYALYHAKYRKDKHPSLCVNKDKNLFYDYGISKGGDIVDLVALVFNISNKRAIASILDGNTTDAPFVADTSHEEITTKCSDGQFDDVQDVELGNMHLLNYVRSRCVNVDVAKRYCREVYYSVRGKRYYAIGFPNIKGGWELRNAYFKGSIAPKSPSLVVESSFVKSLCFVFEGFFDFLSYLTLRVVDNEIRLKDECDFVVLNSVSLVRDAVEILSVYDEVVCYLDNDDAGRLAFKGLQDGGIHAIDGSSKYRDYDDVNEYLMALNNKK